MTDLTRNGRTFTDQLEHLVINAVVDLVSEFERSGMVWGKDLRQREPNDERTKCEIGCERCCGA